MVGISLILKKITCLIIGHNYWMIIKTILPYFPDERIRYKTYKHCIRCNKTEEE